MFLTRSLIPGILLCLSWPALPLPLSDPERAALDHISPGSLRGHLSFIASDLLEGRDTPSPGLDIAAEYIAAQFRRAGLKPGVEASYFQVAKWNLVDPDLDGFELIVDNRGTKTVVPRESVRLQSSEALELKGVELIKLEPAGAAAWKAEDIGGKAVVIARPSTGSGFRVMVAARAALAKLNPALVVTTFSGPAGRLRNPDDAPRYPTLGIVDSGFRKIVDQWKVGTTGAKLSLKLKAPKTQVVSLKNVIGVLPGSDPVLKDTYVLVTAHYDHIGVRSGGGGSGDIINNGANDDGSGTVSVIEIAAALAKLPHAPRRTLVFMTYFGEEKGLLGSRWYARHPVFPIAKTVADLNLEQLGRTDAPGGSTVGTASVTGFDYSDVGGILHEQGKAMGFKIDKDGNSEAFFARSDNQALADLGVPAHTIAAAYEYPDYHGVGDEWEKIDYDNMAKLDRVIAAAVLEIAGSGRKPAWNPDSNSAAKYRKAAGALSAQ